MQLRGLGNVRPIVLEQALSQEIKPLGVDVDGKEMVLLSVNDGTKQSLLIAEANCKATLDFVLPHRAQPNEVRLEPVSPPEFLQGRPGLARGLDGRAMADRGQREQPAAVQGWHGQPPSHSSLLPGT